MIWMTGIDQRHAPLIVRSLFTYRKKEMTDLMSMAREETGASGVVLLTTCNRTEIYISLDLDGKQEAISKNKGHVCESVQDKLSVLGKNAQFSDKKEPRHSCFETLDEGEMGSEDVFREDQKENSPASWLTGLLCRSKGLEAAAYAEYFTERCGREAVSHLFATSAGLKSSIVAEDQILTQVKEALLFARENGFTDSALEVCFQRALAAAKKVKREVVFTYANRSAIEEALGRLAEDGFDPAGKTCMVIGNGEYGRLAAETLAQRGAFVTMTIRQYHSGMVLIPEGCRKILYGERMQFFPQCDLVISATKSPNYTLYYEQAAACLPEHPMILIDFAVPCDIDPRIRELNGIRLYTVDDFKTGGLSGNDAAFAQAMQILEEAQAEYEQRVQTSRMLGMIVHIGECAGEDAQFRLRRDAKRLTASSADQERLLLRVGDITQKVTEKLLFCLRDELDEETFERCLAVLEEAASSEEEKYGAALQKH